MGWRRAPALALGVGGLVAPAVALAAQPIPSAHYSGRGTDCYNNTASGAYTNCSGRTGMSFQVSGDGRHLLRFVGYYHYYCGAGTTYVEDSRIQVSSTGTFEVSGKYASYGPNHKRNGTIHAFIRGHFTGSGRRADVTYRAADYFFGAPPHSRPCGTQVTGVASRH